MQNRRKFVLILTAGFVAMSFVVASVLADEYNPAQPVPVVLAQPRTVGLSVNYKYK